MNKEDREKLLDVAGFLQGWLAFKKPTPTEEVIKLHFDLVMEVLAKNNEVLDLVSCTLPTTNELNKELDEYKNDEGETALSHWINGYDFLLKQVTKTKD